MKKIQTLAMLCGCVTLLAACSSAPKTESASSASTPTIQTTTSTPKAQEPVAQSKVESVVIPPYLDPANALSSNRSIYFDYDTFVVKSEYQGTLDLHGKYLSKNPKLTIRVEGNADERGSAEYNLALGQKRAEAVVKSLKLYGVADAQMEAVSWGKEKPKALGHDEAAYAQNRRVDLAYPNK